MHVRLISSMLLGGTLAAASPAFAGHVVRQAVPVATGTPAQTDPSIKGNSIAYTYQELGSDADIVIYTISSGTHFTVPISGGQDVEDLDGDYVVFRQLTLGEPDAEIVVYERSSGDFIPLTNDTDNQIDPAISGNLVVWTNQNTSKIWIADLSAADPRASAHQLDSTAGATQFQSAPAISGNTVVFVENGVIISYDVSTNTRVAIASGSQPDVNGSRIVWAAGGDIWLKDGGAAAVNLTSDAAAQRLPKVSSTLVAFEQVMPNAADGSSDIDVRAYDFRTNTIETVAGGAGVQALHDLDGTNLAYTDRSNDPSGDIWLVREVEPDPLPGDEDPCDEESNVVVLMDETFEREHGAPQWEEEDFDSDGHERAVICVTAYNVSSGRMKFNGVQLLGPSDFHNDPVAEFAFDVDLDDENEVKVKLNGKPCNGDDDDCDDDDDHDRPAWANFSRRGHGGGHHGWGHGHHGGGHHGGGHDGDHDDDDDGDDDDDDGDDDDDDGDHDPDCATMRVRVVVPVAAAAHASSLTEGLGGCNVAPAQNSPFALLGLLGLAVLLRRRV